MKLTKDQLPRKHWLYCVDAPDGATYLSRDYTACLRWISFRMRVIMGELTVKQVLDAGYRMRFV